MELKFSDKEEQFRSELRAWLEANADQFPVTGSTVPQPLTREEVELQKDWQRLLYRGGWSGIHWPKQYGGREATLIEQLIFFEELNRANAPDINNLIHFVAQQHAGPTIMLHGTEEQKRKHLPQILAGEQVWCQGFSEPNAGSDLAGLQTRAELKGDRFIINGQKIWSSFAHIADYCEMMVRTDSSAPKHKGISFLIVDMKTPGITARPIKQMTGNMEFCEVFFDDVEVPAENLVGELNNGWKVGMTTLGFERGTAFLQKQLWLQDWVKQTGEMLNSPEVKEYMEPSEYEQFHDRYAALYSEALALKAFTYRIISLMLDRKAPGEEGSIVKIMWSELEQQITRFAMDLKQWRAIYTDERSDNELWHYRFFRSFPRTIAAGSSEIQRNIIGERILKLPR